MAEIILLVLFILLVVLTNTLLLEEDKNSELQKKVNSLLEVKDMFVGSKENNFDDVFNELILAKTENQTLKDKITEIKNENREALSLKEKIEEFSKDHNQPNNIDDILNNAEIGNEFSKSDVTFEKYNTLIEEKKLIENREANTKGQLNNLLKRMSDEGRGFGHPPCWVKSNGDIEYIFDVTISSNSISVRNNKIPSRHTEQMELPINEQVYDKELTENQFLNEMLGIYKWSIKKECRFYVRLIDNTLSGDKNVYKSHRRAVEGRFYIYLVN